MWGVGGCFLLSRGCYPFFVCDNANGTCVLLIFINEIFNMTIYVVFFIYISDRTIVRQDSSDFNWKRPGSDKWSSN